MLEEINGLGGVEAIPTMVARAKDKADPFRLMGFGHRVYKVGRSKGRGVGSMELGCCPALLACPAGLPCWPALLACPYCHLPSPFSPHAVLPLPCPALLYAELRPPRQADASGELSHACVCRMLLVCCSWCSYC